MIRRLRVTAIVDNWVQRQGLVAEHGLAFLVEADDRRILFDTGQGKALYDNAAVLGISLDRLDAIVLSHGHYDHTGALAQVLESAPGATNYLHPAAVEPKYAPHRYIGMPEAGLRALAGAGSRIVWTENPEAIAPGATITGAIPRRTAFEDTGGPFFRDAACECEDTVPDDQALILETAGGVIVLLGYAHAGVVNTLERVAEITNRRKIHAVAGGIHLRAAGEDRLRARQTHSKHSALRRLHRAIARERTPRLFSARGSERGYGSSRRGVPSNFRSQSKGEDAMPRDAGFTESAISRAIIESYHRKLASRIDSDVIIAGAGPSGLVAASCLAAAGQRVTIIEKRLSPGGGIWGGAMGMNEVVVQDAALPILSEASVASSAYCGGLHVVDAAELACALCLQAIRAGAVLLNLIQLEDLCLREGAVTGVVANRTTIAGALPVDPIVFSAGVVVDATGHEAVAVEHLRRRALLDACMGPGEAPMDAPAGESFVVEKVAEVYPGLWVTGMSVCATFGGPRMGPIFGGMLLSGKRVAEMILGRSPSAG